MLTGSDHYLAFDIIKFASVKQNLKIFDELVELFRNREPIPGEAQFPVCRTTLFKELQLPFTRYSQKKSRMEAWSPVALKKSEISCVVWAKTLLTRMTFRSHYDSAVVRGPNLLTSIGRPNLFSGCHGACQRPGRNL